MNNMNDSHDQRSVVDRDPSTPNLQALSEDDHISRVEDTSATDTVANNEDPPVEIEDPDRIIQCKCVHRTGPVTDLESLYGGFMGTLLRDTSFRIDESSIWTSWDIYDKSLAEMQNNPDAAEVAPVARALASAIASAVILAIAEDEEGQYIPLQQTSELMFQPWLYISSMAEAIAEGYLTYDLRTIIRGPMVNQGIHDTIREALELGGVSPEQIDTGVRTTFSAYDPNPAPFQKLMGTQFGQAVAMMCENYRQRLAGKRVGYIHVWNDIPDSDADGFLVFELHFFR